MSRPLRPGHSRCSSRPTRSESETETEARTADRDAWSAVVAVARSVIAVPRTIIPAGPVVAVAIVSWTSAPAAAQIIADHSDLLDWRRRLSERRDRER